MKKTGQSFFKFRSILLLLAFAAAVCGCSKLTAQKNLETELTDGQRKAEIQVISITGNELTYMEMESEEAELETGTETETETGTDAKAVTELESEAGTEEATESGSRAEMEEQSQAAAAEEVWKNQAEGTTDGKNSDREEWMNQRYSESQNGRQMPGGASGERPQFSKGMSMSENMELPGEMSMPENMDLPEGMSMPENMDLPEGISMPENMDLPEGMENSGDTGLAESMKNVFASGMNVTTVYLPVGVKVHTDNGKTATFSILEAGDQLEVLMEKNANGEDVITEIWLTGME